MKKSKLHNFVFFHWEFVATSIGLSILVLLSLDHIFFWDTVQLSSKHATFFYNNNLQLDFLPNEIDSGHIPTFGYLLAVLWTVFGKSLWISHLFILPFAVGIAWQLYRLASHFFSKKNVKWVMLIVLIDTTILSQISLVSPDVPLLFFFLLGINAIIKRNKWAIALAFSCLFLISLRGMILTVPLFLFELWMYWKWKEQNAKQRIVGLIQIGLPYIPAAIIFVAFSYYHYLQKGWIGYHEESPWAVFFEKVDVTGNLKNAAIYGWRIIDFGRIFVWIVAVVSLFLVGIQSSKTNAKFKELLLLFILIVSFLAIPAILYEDLKGHRYFMPVYISFSLVSLFLLLEMNTWVKWRKIGLAILFAGLISGSFWVYPKHISQGWDSTLGHFPYYSLRQNMIEYMDNNNLDKEQIGYDFPGAYPQYYLDLGKEKWMFPEVDIATQNYILYSNAVNEFTDEEIKELENNWEVLHTETSLTVFFVLYKRK